MWQSRIKLKIIRTCFGTRNLKKNWGCVSRQCESQYVVWPHPPHPPGSDDLPSEFVWLIIGIMSRMQIPLILSKSMDFGNRKPAARMLVGVQLVSVPPPIRWEISVKLLLSFSLWHCYPHHLPLLYNNPSPVLGTLKTINNLFWSWSMNTKTHFIRHNIWASLKSR